jgi:lipopolysaccharide transport system permease protein
MSSILVSAFDFFMAFVVFVGLMIYYQMAFSWMLFVYVPASLLLTIVTVFGAGSLLAALNVKYRDFRYIIPFLVQALMFLTPVIYPVSIITYPWAKYLIALNPMSGAVNLMRGALIQSPPEAQLLIISVISAVVLIFAGLLYFKKAEAYFADIA